MCLSETGMCCIHGRVSDPSLILHDIYMEKTICDMQYTNFGYDLGPVDLDQQVWRQ